VAASEPLEHPPTTNSHPRSLIIGGLALLAVLAAGADKALLFHNLEYVGNDLYSFLEMTRSWLYTGPLLHDNLFGSQGAIHNYYGLLAFAPLTILLGAYGLILGLVLVHAAAVWRVAASRALDRSARLMILSGALGPVAFFVFDNPRWGFHPELLYPPLVLLLAVELLEGWSWRAVAICAAIVLVKEDGAVVCAAVVLAHTAWRVLTLWPTSKDAARRALRSGLASLAILAVVFLGGLGLLFLMSDAYADTQVTFSARFGPSLKVLARTLTGHGEARIARLKDQLEILVLLGLPMFLPLGRRLPRGSLLFAVAAPPLVAVVLVSAAYYRFNMMLWAPRVATLMVGVVAALVFASVTPPGRRPPRVAVVLVLVALSWAVQLGVFERTGYSIGSRLSALATAVRPPKSPLTPEEDRVLRCVAARLPMGLPVSAVWNTHPLFHRQSIVFADREQYAWHAPRLRVVPASAEAGSHADTPCRGPEVGSFAVELECELQPLIAGCKGSP
jgi:hypothetical protein